MRYWDSSAVISLIAEQPGSSALKPLMEADRAMTLWWGTPVEVASGLCRLRRENAIDEETLARLLNRAQQMSGEADATGPSEPLREEAIRLIKVHDLRAGDALQLAAALACADHKPSGMGFVCLDKRLRNAAAKEGFTVLPE